MTPAAEAMTGELAEMLAVRDVVDPRSVLVRFSALKEIERSPFHYLHAVQDDREETLAMRLGSGAHALLLGKPVRLWNQPAKKGDGKAPRQGKAWDEFRAENPDALILNAREMAEADAMTKAVRAHRRAMELIEGTIQERTVMWEHRGRRCRSTPDIRSRLHVVEFKTCQNAEPSKFRRDAYWRHYHAQLAFYLDAITASGEGEPQEAYIIAVESSEPYGVSVMPLTDRAIRAGRQLYCDWFLRLLDCEARNEWSGYEEVPFDVDGER